MSMWMWGIMIPNMGNPNFPTRITMDVIEMLCIKYLPRLDMVLYPYFIFDWRGCPNILFTLKKPMYDRGKFSVMFELI